jgi:hypothetical protein
MFATRRCAAERGCWPKGLDVVSKMPSTFPLKGGRLWAWLFLPEPKWLALLPGGHFDPYLGNSQEPRPP